MKKSMPFEPFRTHTQPVNLAVLEERFDAGAEVTPDALRAKGLAKRKGIPVKILAQGELSKALDRARTRIQRRRARADRVRRRHLPDHRIAARPADPSVLARSALG